MPLDELQKLVLAALKPNRSPASVFAGGSVLQRHGYRLSDDQDIFHDAGTDVVAISERDAETLKVAGFAVDLRHLYPGFSQADVGLEGLGVTRIQWAAAGAWMFFAPVPDDAFGWRLHIADLAANKVLAAAGRKEVRDFVDLAFIHRHVIPLWHAIWAAPGKDETWSPCSLAERIARNNGFRQDDVDRNIDALIDVSAADIGRTVRDAIDEARDIFARLPDHAAGRLFVDQNGAVIDDAETIVDGRSTVSALAARRGGTWPSGPGIDGLLIRRAVDAFGWEGSNLSAPMA